MVESSSSPPTTGRRTNIALAVFTGALVLVSALQFGTLRSQKRIQEASTRSNVAPSYGGKSSEARLVLKMTNTGAIPARDVTVVEARGLIDSEQDLRSLCAQATPAGNPVTIHPGFAVEHHITAPMDEDAKAFGGRHYAVCGEINYTDDLGEGVPSEFCLSFSEAEFVDPERIKNHDHTICVVPSTGP